MIDVQRPAEAPASLAEGKRYDGEDVLEALHVTFLGKCYLCETEIEVGTFEVDHRKPRRQFPHLTHAWANLFPTCNQHRCNQRRKAYPEGGLVNPGEGVETRIVQRITGTVSAYARRAERSEITFRAVDPPDTRAANTAAELDHIHNARDTTRPHAARALRMRIWERIVTITPDVYEYASLGADLGANAARLGELRDRVERLVSRRAPYSVLVRSYFAHIEAVRALFD